ncbi:histamine H3 receptor-like [Strongylocentrotus purpuratus]|uniref:G-protein coupled receptors family 1 profile domain-containing protein n=1 Tax=Strongylocentrotus purpuratus TaxID=7668 RepID=A0A7M7P0Z4_STRPU|nr:histamine H3 receptor-like [Strongylocentrotus purpuratus]
MEPNVSMFEAMGANETDIYGMPKSVVWLATVPLLLSIISIVTIIGNAFVITAFFVDQRIRDKPSNILILSLSITDVLIGLIILPGNMIYSALDRWPFGEVACKVWLVLDYTLCMVSVWTVVLISLDRYWLVKKQLMYASFQTSRRVIISLLCAWCACAAIYTFLAFGWRAIVEEVPLVDFTRDCELEFSYNAPTTLSINAVEFVIPLLAIVYLNMVLYIHIRKGPKGIVRRRISSSNGQAIKYIAVCAFKLPNDSARQTNSYDVTPRPSSVSEESQECDDDVKVRARKTRGRHEAEYRTQVKMHAQHRKAAFFLAVFVGVFMFCWLPYQFTSIRLAFCGDCVFELTWDITNYLLWCNSTINPFLYALTNLRFRRNFVQLFYRYQRLCCPWKRTFEPSRIDSEGQ